MIQAATRLNQVGSYYFAKKLASLAEIDNETHPVINLGIGSPDLQPPSGIIEHLSKDIASESAHRYQSYYGISELRMGFAQFYQTHFNTKVNFENEVLPLIGSKEGIMHISMSFVEDGDIVLVPNPAYPSYASAAKLAGAQVESYKLSSEHNWLPDFQALETMDLQKVKLMWVNYPHMPTGAKASIEVFERLVAFGKKHNILICHDNPYAFILNENPLSILSVPGAKETALELCSLSKCFNMAGWRVGAVIGHEDYISTIVKFKSNMDSGMFRPIQVAAAKALALGEEWFEALNLTYRKRYHEARKIFDHLNIKYETNGAGMFLWGRVPNENGVFWSDLILKQTNVFITPGIIFGSQGDKYLRISLCSKPEAFAKALERIKSLKL
ncbi:MAG: aminotransferase class I/II-fold pyridoxal phosphate-dependent enzyme [Saprospiraceae bacterium]|nr:aminotransferase class I/II-fold pyridoxal phosphate-dependent enzyme [Saprospiraceae bacterium]